MKQRHESGRYTGIVIGALAALAIVIGLWAMIDTMNMERQSLKERVATLEEQMKEKTRPVIHIQNASVYNADGEVAIEEKQVEGER